MKVYTGIAATREVRVQGPHGDMRLDEYFEVYNHSPDGFNWSYNGSGPAQLALAILVDLFGNHEEALAVYQQFKEQVIAQLPAGDFRLEENQIWKVISQIRKGEPRVWPDVLDWAVEDHDAKAGT